jgi:hypothetical protein
MHSRFGLPKFEMALIRVLEIIIGIGLAIAEHSIPSTDARDLADFAIDARIEAT